MFRGRDRKAKRQKKAVKKEIQEASRPHQGKVEGKG